MNYLLALALSVICVSGFADKLQDTIETLEGKVLWSHVEGEKYQEKADLATDIEEANINLDKALKFYSLEREYSTELCLYKLVSQCKEDFVCSDCADENDQESEYHLDVKSILSNISH